MRVEPDAVAVGNAMRRPALADLEQRAQLGDTALVEPLEPGERRDFRLERVERRALVLARNTNTGILWPSGLSPNPSGGASKKGRLASVSARTRRSPSA